MILCLDIGGSWIKSAVALSPDRIEMGERVATPLHDAGAFLSAVSGVVDRLAVRPDKVAISLTGVVDPVTGTLTCANIPCIHGRPLASELQVLLGLPVAIANDADCFVLAEAGLGAGRGHPVVFGIILGSGVGGGLVVDGRLINSAGGLAGEWGHGPILPVLAGHPPVILPSLDCGCGQTGCVNTLGGARGLEYLHTHLYGQEATSTAIVAGWIAQAPEASRTIDVYVDLLAGPLALAVNITGASIVPAGGGLANSAPLIQKIDQTVRSRILRRLDRSLIVPAECAMEPGLIGAALLGLGSREHGRDSARNLR